jgi:hypothetical protein
VQDDHALWIVKFGRQDDRWDNPRVEHGLLKLARTCGLNAPPTAGSKPSPAAMACSPMKSARPARPAAYEAECTA